jgi:hypothetical protein
MLRIRLDPFLLNFLDPDCFTDPSLSCSTKSYQINNRKSYFLVDKLSAGKYVGEVRTQDFCVLLPVFVYIFFLCHLWQLKKKI